jgi:hypothetical protein
MRTATFVALLCVALSCAANPLDSELARLDALQTKLEARPWPEMLKGEVAPGRKSLDAARAVQDPRERLHKLRAAFTNIETLAYIGEHEKAAENMEALHDLWSRGGQAIQPVPSGARTLLHQGLIESSINRAEKLYHASLPYGKASGPLSGLYYLADAEANAKFAKFVASLPAGKAERPPDAKALRAVLESQEAELQQRFAKDPAGRGTIGTSAKLKEARELLEANRLAGATLLLLEAKSLSVTATDSIAKLLATPRNSEEPRGTGGTPVKVALIRWPYT